MRLLCSILILLSFHIEAAQWGVGYGGTGSDAGRAITTDGSGNVFVTGWFSGSFSFGGTTLTSAGGLDVFIAKLNSSGVLQWVKGYGGAGTEVVTCIAVDPSGNIFIGGNFSGTANLGGTNMVSAGGQDMFIAKYDTSGNFVWEKAFGDTLDDVVNAITVDSGGNVIATGYFEGGVDFGAGTIFATFGGPDTFLLKLSSASAYVWNKTFTNFADDRGTGVAVDGSDNVIICGYYLGSQIDLGGGALLNHGASDGYVGKFDSSGNFVWATNPGGTGTDQTVGVRTDLGGNVYLLGFFTSAATIAGVPLTTAGGWDTFLAKYSPSGSGLWAKSFPSPGNFDLPVSLGTDTNGNVAIIGHFTSTINLGGGSQSAPVLGTQTIFDAQYNSNGDFLWSQIIGSTGADLGAGAAIDNFGRTTFTGSFAGSGTFGGQSLTSAGSDDIFISQFSAASNLRLTLSSDGMTGTGLALQWILSGLTGNYYSCEVATNGTTFFQSNVTASTFWNITVANNQTWKFRLQSIVGGVAQGDFSPTNSVYGDSKPENVSISSSTTSSILLSFKNLSIYETGFLAEQSTNASFANSTFYNVPPTPQGPANGTWPQTFTFLPDTIYYYRLYATNRANGTTNAGITLPSATVSIAPNQTAQAASLFTSRTTDTANQIVNTWFSGGGSINNWILQESLNATTWTTVAAPVNDPVNGMTFTTNGLTPGVTYYWRVFATNGAGASPIVTNVVYMPIPGTPTGGNWYVDLAATNSNNAGTNWANAWRSLSSANWAAVSAGTASPQTIWVAKGNYNESAVMMTPGTGALVTMHAATNTAQKGTAAFLSLTPYRARFIINGSMDDTFAVPTGAYPALFSITNNCGFTIASLNGAIGRGVYSPTDSTSNQVFWCIIGPVGIWHTGLGESDQGGIGFINTTSGGTEMAYNYISDIFGTAITMNGGQEAYGTTAVHHNIIDRVHCNYVVTGYGADVYNNYLLGVAQFQVGHPDGYQPAAAWTRFANNYVKDVPNGRLFYPEMFRTNVDPNIMVVGNLFWFDSQQPAEAIDFTTEPLTYNGGTVAWPSMTFSNILIANNTMVNLGTSLNARRSDVTNLFVKSFWFLNNVMSGDGGGFSLVNLGNPSDTTGFINPTYDATQVIVDKNIIENGLIRYNSNILTVAGLPFAGNLVQNPGFMNKGDFHMTNAVAGTNLTAWLTQCPFLATDMDGVTRSTWQMGAFETVVTTANTNDAALVAWYRGADLSDGIHDDSFNHANGFMFDQYHFPIAYAGPTTNVPHAWAFTSFHSANPDFFGEGQYAGVTYTNNIDGMTNATFAWWGKNFVSPDGTLGSVQNSVWFSSGAENDNEAVGSFYLGRHGTPNTVAIIQTNNSTTHPIIISYPDTTSDGSTPWNHYALTFDGTKWIGYFNGSPFQTNTPPVVSKLRVGGSWMSISSWPHNGTPQWNTPGTQLPLGQYRLDDGYPNAGFENGAMADFRIYARALTGPQVLNLFTNVGTIDPQITNQPVSVAVGTNTTPTFTVGASGTSLTYQWSKSGITISGATQSAYTTPATVCGDNGSTFSCAVTGSSTVQSSAATLTITNCPAPGVDIIITQQPTGQTVNQGSNATFTVSATGGSTLHYAWTFAGVSVGADAPTYTRTNCQLSDSQQDARVTVSDASGSLPSNTARLVVIPNTSSLARITNLRVGSTRLRP